MQLSFWGYDAEGNGQTSGHRIVYVYRDTVRHKVKIGFTTRDGKTRMKEQQTGNPDPFEFVGSFVVRDDQDDHDIHRMVSKFHYRGEWFDETPELMAILMRLIRNPVVFRIAKSEFEPAKPNTYRQAMFQLGCLCGNPVWFSGEFQGKEIPPHPLSGRAICPVCARPLHFEFEFVDETRRVPQCPDSVANDPNYFTR